MKRLLLASAAVVALIVPARAQMAVIDAATLAQAVQTAAHGAEQVAQLTQQIAIMQQQYAQLMQTYQAIAYSVDPDQPFRLIVITCHGDRNHAVHHARGAHGGRLWVVQDRYH